MRLVLDTDVLIAGLRSDRGASRQLLLLALDKQLVMLASVPLMIEYESVATRAEQLKQSCMSTEDTNLILDAFAAVVEPVNLRFLWRPRLKDPGDEMVLETAVNGGADHIATFNLRHLAEAAAVFGIRAARPGEILREIKGADHEKK
jgi:putative PIN family toxin of toxin-antitoxin system